MVWQDFLVAEDAERCERVLSRVTALGANGPVLAGSLALDLHLCGRDGMAGRRRLNDIDLVLQDASCLPPRLSDGYMVRHFHPDARPGQILLQIVDVADAVRIDIFVAHGDAVSRSSVADFPACPVKVLPLEDAAAKIVSLVLDLGENEGVPRKFATRFHGVKEQLDFERLAAVWPQYRRQRQPQRIEEALERAESLTHSHAHLLYDPVYGQDPDSACPRCAVDERFPFADPREIHAILGYV